MFLREVWHFVKHVLAVGLDTVIPPICVGCDDVVAGRQLTTRSRVISSPHGLCYTCWNEIIFCGDDVCITCGVDMLEGVPGLRCMTCIEKQPYFDVARGVWQYNQTAVDIVLKFKHGDATHYAPMLSDYMAVVVQKMANENDVVYDAIMPVPLHQSRLMKRQYNQSALLGRRLSKILGIPMIHHSLRRIKRTDSQGKFSTKERHKNVKNAFDYKPDIVSKLLGREFNPQGKNILLIDDVITSGATINACAKVLKDNGAERVDVIALCRAIRHKV